MDHIPLVTEMVNSLLMDHIPLVTEMVNSLLMDHIPLVTEMNHHPSGRTTTPRPVFQASAREELVGEVEGLVGEVEEMLGEVEELVGEVVELVGEVEELVGEVEGLVGEVEELVGEVEELVGEVEELPSLDLQTFDSDRFPFNSPTRDGEEEEEEEQEEEEEEEEVTVVGGECFQSEVIPLAPHWPGPVLCLPCVAALLEDLISVRSCLKLAASVLRRRADR
ncbi:unnamed protein product [Boreogadus saida]